MYFIKVNINNCFTFNRLEAIKEENTLKQYFDQIKPTKYSGPVKKLECFIGMDENYDKQNLFWVDIDLKITAIREVFTNFTRVLFEATIDSHTFDQNNPSENNVNAMLMRNAAALQYPNFDSKFYPGEKKLWNLIVICLKNNEAGFRSDELSDMKEFMNIIFDSLW